MMKTILKNVIMMEGIAARTLKRTIAHFVNARILTIKTTLIKQSIQKYAVNQCGLVMETVMMRTISKNVIMMMEIVAVILNICIVKFVNAL